MMLKSSGSVDRQNIVNPSLLASESKLVELESVRGIAALLVLIHHIPGWNLTLYYVGFIRSSNLMVDLFFVLSGFVIYKTYSLKITKKIDLVRFQFLRFGRLYPVHFLLLMIFLSIEFAKYFVALKLGIRSSHTTPFEENNWLAFIQHIFLVQDIGPTGNGKTFNAPSWSISVEFYTYLVFGLIVLFANKFKVIIAVLIACFAIFCLFTNFAPEFRDVLRCFAGFFSGCCTAYFYTRIKIKIPPYITIITFLTLFIFLHYKPNPDYDTIIYVLTSILILSITSAEEGLIIRMLKTKLFIWLGSISYSVYMTHVLIIWVLNQFFRVVLNKPEVLIDGFMTPQLTILGTSIAYIITIMFVLFLSFLVYEFVEKPLRVRSRQMAFAKLV